MHHCLQIYEVLILILEATLYQTKNYKPTLDRRSLAALLRTCRYFSVPAIKLLWRELPTLAPLILTLPEDLVEVEGNEGLTLFSPRTVTFRRDTSPNDWERFDLYAPLVKQIGIASPYERSPANFMILSDRIGQELNKRTNTLLPNLSTIMASSNDLPFAGSLLTSHVERIQLNMHPNYVIPLFQLLVDIPFRAPTLKSLHLCQSTVWKTWEQTLLLPGLCTALEGLDLEEFECEWLDLSDEAVETLIRMPRLRKLGLSKDIPGLERALRTFPFPAPRLEEISLWTDGVGPSPLAQILVLLRPSHLEAFRLQPTDTSKPCTQKELNALISAVESHCSPKFLTSFVLEGWRDANVEWPAIVDCELLRPLFAFSNIRHFTLAAYPFDFNDAEVKELATSWPHLEELYYDTSYAPPPARMETRTTLRCLLWFAVYCRNLSSLSFSFNGIDTFSDTEISMASNHQLSFLSVGYSTITEPNDVSAFLNIVFPSLSLLIWTNSHREDDGHDEVWRKVEANIQR